MKKALIQGIKILQIVTNGDEFDVHESLIWVDVPDDTTTDDTYVDGQVIKYTPPDETIESVSEKINLAMYKRIEIGVKWALNGGSTIYDVPLTDSMEGFLSRNLMKLNESRTNPHKGFIFNGAEKFNINDDGFRELAVFSGEWGDEISRIRLDEIESLQAMTQQQLNDYDSANIDWSVDWSQDPQNNGNGWDDDLCKQSP